MMTSKAQIAGDWKATLNVQGMGLEMIFHINETDGLYSATLDVPQQGASGIAVECVQENGEVRISAPQLGLAFKGTFSGDTIEGNFEQAGMSFPLLLTRFESKLPGDPSLPSTQEQLTDLVAFDKGDFKYRVEDYFSRPKASSFQLSPNGKYMSYREKDENNKRHVFVKELTTGKSQRVIEEKDELIRGYGWINDERLLYVMDKGGNENYHIYAVDIDGGNSRDLTPFDGVRAMLANELKDQKDYVIVLLNKNNPQIFEPYRLNIVTGDLVQLFENKDVNNPIQQFVFDKDGELRGYSKMVNGVEKELYYKDLSTGEFRLVKKTNWYDAFEIMDFNYSGTNKDEAYVATNLDSDKMRIVLYDFKTDKTVKELYTHADYDISNVSFSRKRNYEIDFYAYQGDKYTIVPISAFYKDLHNRIQKEFPDKAYSITGNDDDENTILLIIDSDKLFGTYYQYDVKTKKFTLLYDLMPQLKENDMAEMRPITFTSRDGLTIHGYITLPQAALQGKKVPLIVNPHGGPQGIRDSWGFSPETQLFASRGYATLQVNFRISGGYGKNFLKAGFKQVGRSVMDDVEDGVKYVLSQGWIDKDRIAIYGGSHGGYATLMGLIKTPDLYTCGVDYCGISSIFTFFDSFPEYWKPLK
ncbi:MAG: prolyl oligopeptidase family serine peptidase, partial [Bacteroidales bacterium]|nr:prolyl oligopeptidase family serine peptidase [Bacteroidales bacterium]